MTREEGKLEKVDLAEVAASVQDAYSNFVLSEVNDHVVRISVMTEPFYWHSHPDSDEVFHALEGGLLIEFEDRQVELRPGQMLRVPAGAVHRTSPIGPRSVNLTIERADAATERTE
jgi:mannose-6-phosphate isomerase-like protein (cupin superfamily)